MSETIKWPYKDDAHENIPRERLFQEMREWAESVCTGETREITLHRLFELDVVEIIAFREHVKANRIVLDPIDPERLPDSYLTLPSDELHEWWQNSYATTQPTRTPPVGRLGLIIDWERRTVGRQNSKHVVDLSRSDILWHSFKTFYDAGDV